MRTLSCKLRDPWTDGLACCKISRVCAPGSTNTDPPVHAILQRESQPALSENTKHIWRDREVEPCVSAERAVRGGVGFVARYLAGFHRKKERESREPISAKCQNGRSEEQTSELQPHCYIS